MKRTTLLTLMTLLLALAPPAPAAESGPTGAFKDINGSTHHPLATSGRKATVLIFVWHTCPVANSYAPEIERIYQEYKEKGVAVFLVHVDPTLKDEKARKHAADYQYTLPVLIDHQHALVKATGATMTPEAVVLLPDGKMIYNGRIDNRQAALGKRRPQATELDLRNTLDAILAGKKLEPRSTEVIGCYVPEID
ncbi:MAG: redoxin family protein [Rhodospirillales bacterium]|nr:redoxin family protein [Rhodospirillales bacterium]